MTRYIGVDLHSNSLTACFLKAGQEPEFKTYRLLALDQLVQELQRTDQVAVEATGNTRFFVDRVAPGVQRVVVVDPGGFDVIKKSVKKTDKNDARARAVFLSKGLLPEARMKAPAQARISSRAQTRDKLVKLRTTLINKIHALLNARGLKSRKEAYSGDVALKRVLQMEFDPLARVEVEVIVSQIRSLTQGIQKLDQEINQQASNLEGHRNLISIKGIGAKSAAILLSVIGPIQDFESEEKLASSFGLVPRVANSNDQQHHGRITKRGSKLGRTTLVQCTLIAIRYSPYLRTFYDRIKHKPGAGKAIIATARKFLGIIYRTLKHNWVFADFPNFVLAES